MELYKPDNRIQSNIEIILAEYDPTKFYELVWKLDDYEIKELMKGDYEKVIDRYNEVYGFLPLHPDSKNGVPFIEVIERISLIPRRHNFEILSGLKEFYTKEYDEFSFERAAAMLGIFYPNETHHNSEIFEILDQAIKINTERDKDDPISLHRRFHLFSNASWYGARSPNKSHQEKASQYGGYNLEETEEQMIYFNSIYQMLSKE